MFGGKPTPGCGFAMGIERLLELMKASGERFAANQCDVYIVHQGDAAQMQGFVASERLRDAGLDVVLHCASSAGPGSFKSQMKRADASGAAYAIIIGEDEVANETAIVKALRSEDMENNQSVVPFTSLAEFLVDQIVGGDDGHDHSEHVHYHH
jgi:histidyl-tRNA synthetase